MTDTDDARAVLSEMIEITEQTIGQAFHRHADLDALYRECPTAFWLAPDGDGVLLSPAPMMSQPIQVSAEEAPIDPTIVEGRSSGIVRAMLAAGPIFAATGLMLNQTNFDDHWWDPFGRALLSLIAFPLTITIGALLALLPVLTGVLALGQVGTIFPAVRRPAAWAMTGGVMGMLIAAVSDVGGAAALALVATSVACARIARSAIAWTDPELA